MSNNKSSDSDIINLFTVLNDDVVTDLINTRQDSNQFHRRTLIRSVFAYIEGVTFILKQTALARTEYASDLYSNAEKVLLADEGYSLNNKYEVVAQPKFIRTEDNIFLR